MIRNLQKLLTLITLSVLAHLSLFGQTESAIKNVFWQPNELLPGSVTFFTVELNRDARVCHEMLNLPHEAGDEHTSDLIGIKMLHFTAV
jgi:hypothetical protein